MRIETKITLILLGIALVVAGGIALIHPRSDVIALNLNTGETRVDRFLYGFQFSREAIPSCLEWLHACKGGSGDQWITTLERDFGSPFRRGTYRRRVGQVYIDAFTLAPLVQSDPTQLRLLLRQIASADTQRIWDIRQDLRRTFDSRQAARRGQ